MPAVKELAASLDPVCFSEAWASTIQLSSSK